MDLFGSLQALFSGPSFSTLCLLFRFLSLSICLGTGQPEINQKLRATNKIASFPKKWIGYTYKPELDLFIYWIFRWFLRIIFFHGQKSKQLITLIGWAIFSSTHSKTVLSVIGKTKPTKPKQVKPSQTFGYTSVFLSGIAGASSTWREHLSAIATGSEEMDDYDVYTKTCMKLGPRYLPRRTKTRSKLGDPQTMQNWLQSVDFKGTPLCGCKNGSKTTILNKGFNKEQLA